MRLGWRGIDHPDVSIGMMEEGLPKEEMVEEEVVMVLDTFFRHQSLT